MAHILCYSLAVRFSFLGLFWDYYAKRLARKHVSETTYFVSSGT